MIHTNQKYIDNQQRIFIIKDVYTRDAPGLQILGYDIQNELTGEVKFLSEAELTNFIKNKLLKII